jgi:radical SAM superfamily enzyme YgiQ (UPF0313 family)
MIRKIALINPKKTIFAQNECMSETFKRLENYIRPWYAPPLNLLTIASVTPANIEIDLIDNDFDEITYKADYDFVGITAMTQQATNAFLIADNFRKLQIPVVMGGIHPTLLPEECLEHSDYVIIGEAEELWPVFLNDFNEGNAKRIYRQNSDNRYDIKKSPVPRYDLIKKENLKKNEHYFNLIPVQATRGCPHNCSFCSVSKILGKKIRKKNIHQIYNEIKTIKDLFGNQLIVFVDDNLFVDKQFAKNLLTEITPLGIKWFAQTDVAISEDPDLLRLAYNSGCLMLLIGFESLSINNLKNVNENQWKAKKIELYDKTVQVIQENGIIAYAAFIFGFQDDDETTFRNVRDFMLRNKCLGQFTLLTPLPGTQLYNDYKEKGFLISETYWDQCTFFDVVIKHNVLTKKSIEENLSLLYNDIYNDSALTNRIEYLKGIYKKLPARWTVYES